MKAQDGWRESTAQAWVQLQDKTDAYLEALGNVALERLDPRPGERVLDVGCGAGQTTIELARRVAPGGKVIAVDISEPMVAAARERVARAGLSDVDIILGDAASADVGSGFDAIYSRFGVMFFEDSISAFAKLRGSLKPSGRIAFVCWQAIEFNDWSKVALDAARSVVPDQPLPSLLQPGKPGPFYFADASFVREILTASGYQRIAIEPHASTLRFGAARSLDEVVEYALQIGPAARFIADADRALLPEFKRALAAAYAPYVTADGLLMPARTWIVSAFAN